MTDQATAVEPQDPQAALLSALDNSPPETEEVEASAETEQEEQAEEVSEEEQEEEKPAVSQKFRVKVKNDRDEDEERDLSLEELAAGYMQSADYTRKAQALAAERKTQQEEVAKSITQTTQQAVQQVQALQQLVIASAAPELKELTPELAYTDPARYVQLQAKQQQLSQVLGHLQHEQAKLLKQQEETTKAQRDQALKQSLDYLSKELPGVNLEKEAGKLREVAKKYSFSDEEIAGFSDGRLIHLLHDAAKWRELQTAKPKALQKVAEAPKVIKPAAPQPRKQNQSALDRLKKTGRPSELVNFL